METMIFLLLGRRYLYIQSGARRRVVLNIMTSMTQYNPGLDEFCVNTQIPTIMPYSEGITLGILRYSR